MSITDTTTDEVVEQTNTVNVSLSLDPATLDAADVRLYASTPEDEFGIVELGGADLIIHKGTDVIAVADAFDRLAHRIRTAIIDGREASKAAA